MLGESSTLFNPGSTTNFIYKIEGIQNLNLTAVNAITTKPKIKNRIKYINDHGGELVFDSIESETLKLNLILIDSLLPDILSNLLLYYYTQTAKAKVKDLIKYINELNPLNFNLSEKHPLYEHKIKNFLTDTALGMTPAKVWQGIYDATGGIIFVKSSGEVLCYHIYNRNEFQEYLISNTKLEQASTSRYRFGEVYRENGQYFIKLNLQIRFI
jgi:type II restriction enzyme